MIFAFFNIATTMKKTLFFSLLSIALLFIACNKNESNLTVKIKIEGLKKGTLYLKKYEDTLMVTIDSLEINGNPNIELHGTVDTPELFYLQLDKQGAKNEQISFFADKGTTEIYTSLKEFSYDAKINGSQQQKILEKYYTLISKLNNRNLDLIKEQFDASKQNDTIKLNAIKKEANNSLKRKYLYTVNFALNNKNSEVAPYLALKELYNARIDLLDTINKVLTPKVKASKYGKSLQVFINKIKKEPKNN